MHYFCIVLTNIVLGRKNDVLNGKPYKKQISFKMLFCIGKISKNSHILSESMLGRIRRRMLAAVDLAQ